MGIAGSKTRLPVDRPPQNGTLMVTLPSMTSSTPSSPNRDVSPPRNRSQSFNAGLLESNTEKAKVSGDNDVDSGGESIGFSLAELAHYCNTNNQHASNDYNEENQLPGGQRTCESREYDDIITISSAETRGNEPFAETSSPSNAPLQVCGVKPPMMEQQAQKASSADETTQPPSHSPVQPTKSDGSSDSQQPRQRVNNAVETWKKTAPKLSEIHTRRSSEAITNITQAKKLSHRLLQSQRQKKSHLAESQRRRYNEQQTTTATPPPNGTKVSGLPKRCPSAKSGGSVTKNQQPTGRGNGGRGSRIKQQSSFAEEKTRQPSEATTDNMHSKKEEHHVSVTQKTPATASGSKEASTQQQSVVKPVTPSQDEPQPPRPEIKDTEQSKPTSNATQPASSVNQKSTSTISQKSVHPNAKASQPAADDNDDDDDDDDWENQITALRDPDDIRNRKIQPRKDSNWNLWISKISKPAVKDEKQKATKGDGKEEIEVNYDSYIRDTNIHKSAISMIFSFYRAACNADAV